MHMCLYIFSKQYNDDIVFDLMEKYDENKTVEPYVYLTKEEAIKKKRDEINRTKKEYDIILDNSKLEECQKNWGKHYIDYLRNDFPKKLSYTDEQCYYEMINEWFCAKPLIGPNGEIMSTYNPDSKWDWYELGGRWHGILKTKDGRETTACQLKDLNIDELEGSYSFLTLEDEWLERDDYKDEEFDKKFREYVKSLDPNTWIIQVDYHI